MSRLWRYIARVNLGMVTLAASVVASAVVLVDLVDQMRQIGDDAQLDLRKAIELAAWRAPGLILGAAPFIVLIGAMATYTRLARRNELVVARASGASAWRFVSPALVLAAMLGLGGSFALAPFAERATGRAEDLRRTLNLSNGDNAALRSQWLRQTDALGETYIEARQVDITSSTLHDARFLHYRPGSDGALSLHSIVEASEAKLLDGVWRLTNGRTAYIAAPRGTTAEERFIERDLPATITALALESAVKRRAGASLASIPAEIDRRVAIGRPVLRLKHDYVAALAAPIWLMAMAAIGAAATLRFARLGGLLQRVLVGAAASLLAFGAAQALGSIAGSGLAPYWLTATLAPITTLCLALFAMMRAEDG